MTREDFHREIGDAFDSISGSPDPALSERVRAGLVEAPEQSGPLWIGALAAAVIAVILVGVLLVGNPLNRPPTTGHGPGPSISPSAVPSPSAAPSASALPFICAAGSSTVTQQTAPPLAYVVAARVGTHTGYDRVTFEFKDARTGTIKLVPQSNAKFITDPKGDTVTLAGKAGLLVKVTGADNHTSFSGSTDLKDPNFPGLLEVRQLGDFEGTVQWGLGLSSNACYRAVIMTSPTRLVIDIQTS